MPTHIAAWGIAVYWTLKAQGLNADEIFANARLSLSNVEHNPSGRIPIDDMTKLWRKSLLITRWLTIPFSSI